MQTPSDYDLSRALYAGKDKHPIDQSLALLQAALPDQSLEALAALTLEARDRLLLVLRERLFGPDMHVMVECPECSETLEMVVPIAQLLDAPEPGADPTPLEVPGATLLLRLPTSADMAALEASETENALLALIDRCVVSAVGDDGAELTGLAPAMLQGVALALQERMPLANLTFELACPDCGHAWASGLEIPEFLWAEVDADVRRVAVEVGVLAGAYGWSEEEILKMSKARRARYLEQQD